MSIVTLAIFVLKFFIPSLFSVLFRAFGLGYRNKKRLIIGLAVFSVYAIAVPSALILTVGYGMFTHLSTVVMTIASMSVLIFTTDSPGKTIFLQLTQNSVNTIMSVILNLIRTVLGLSYPTLVLMLAVTSPLVYVLALRFWAKPLRFLADNMNSDLKSMIALPVITMAVVYFIPVYPAQNFSNHPIYCTMMMLAVECGFLLYIDTFYCSLLKISRLLKEEAKKQMLETEILSYQDSIEAAKQTRHDLHHHNALLLNFLENGNTAGAMEYLRANDRAVSESRLAQFSANPTANAVLRVYSRKTQALEIPFAVGMDDLPEKLPMTAPELGSVLSNLLENAAEACMKVEPFRRQIAIRSETDESGVRLEMQNSVSGVVLFENDLPLSVKPGGGTGTKSIAHIVHQYGGMMRFKQQGSLFITQIFLPFI